LRAGTLGSAKPMARWKWWNGTSEGLVPGARRVIDIMPRWPGHDASVACTAVCAQQGRGKAGWWCGTARARLWAAVRACEARLHVHALGRSRSEVVTARG